MIQFFKALTVSFAEFSPLEENISMVEDAEEVDHHLVNHSKGTDLLEASVDEWLFVDDSILDHV